jgi:hypothetical protein
MKFSFCLRFLEYTTVTGIGVGGVSHGVRERMSHKTSMDLGACSGFQRLISYATPLHSTVHHRLASRSFGDSTVDQSRSWAKTGVF